MRWSYLIPRLAIVGVVWVFFAFTFDPLLRRAMIGSGESLAGTKVDIDGVQTTFFPPSVTLDGVQIASRKDPWKNAVEFQSLRLRLEGRPLLRRSFIIDEATIAGLQWNTPRETSGALEKRDGTTSSKYAKLAAEKAKALGADWYDDFARRMKMQVDPKQFASVKLAGEMQKQWTGRFDSYEKRIKALETKLKQIEKTAKSAKGSTLRKIAAYRKAAVESQQLVADAGRIRRELEQLPKTVNADFARVDAARQQDQRALKTKLDVFKLDADTLSQTLLGPTLQAKMDDAVEWARWIKEALGKVTYRGPRPERMRGVDVPFPAKDRLPKFLVRKLGISGQADWKNEKMPFKGLITGITSDPKLHGQPIVVKLHGKATSVLNLVGTADYTGDKPRHNVRLSFATPANQQLKLGDTKKTSLVISAEKSLWTANVTLEDDALNGVVTLSQNLVHSGMPASRPDTSSRNALDFNADRMLQTALANVKQFKASIVLTGTYQEPKWALQSNLGEQIAAGVNRMIAQELTRKQQQLAQTLDDAVDKKTGDLAKMLNAKYGNLLSQLKLQETGTQQFIKRIAGGGFPATGGLDFNKLPVRLPGAGAERTPRSPLGGLDVNRLLRR